jgi:hypothetical protein
MKRPIARWSVFAILVAVSAAADKTETVRIYIDEPVL